VAKRLGLSKDEDGKVSLASLYSGGGKAQTAKLVVRGSDDIQSAPSEASAERSTGEPEIVYSLGNMVALKRKIPDFETDEQVSIPSKVVKVIGEGKSRRYEVKDLNSGQDNPGGNIYKSTASSMAPFTVVEDIRLDNYEISRPAPALPESTSNISLARPVSTTTPSILFSLAAADSKDFPGAFSLLSKVGTVSRYTISQDNTQGDDARNAALLAAFGKKIRCRRLITCRECLTVTNYTLTEMCTICTEIEAKEQEIKEVDSNIR
jgi:hypothetical protein